MGLQPEYLQPQVSGFCSLEQWRLALRPGAGSLWVCSAAPGPGALKSPGLPAPEGLLLTYSPFLLGQTKDPAS
jgi:hypothetical protein